MPNGYQQVPEKKSSEMEKPLECMGSCLTGDRARPTKARRAVRFGVGCGKP